MDKAGIFCTSNTDISLQKVHHAFFTGNHVAHCFRFIREKAFIRTFQLHLTCHITFEFDAGTEFHRGHLDRLRTYFFLIHHRMGTLQRGAEEAKSLYLHRIALCQPVSKRSGDGLHNTHMAWGICSSRKTRSMNSLPEMVPLEQTRACSDFGSSPSGTGVS